MPYLQFLQLEMDLKMLCLVFFLFLFFLLFVCVCVCVCVCVRDFGMGFMWFVCLDLSFWLGSDLVVVGIGYVVVDLLGLCV